MHVVLAVLLLIILLIKVDYKNVKIYGLTIYYVITCNLLYNTICQKYLLWEYKPDSLLKTHVFVDLIYTFIVLPSITFLFLEKYPKSNSVSKKVFYVIRWVATCLVVEIIFIKTGRLVLQNGYEYWMEFLFYPTMFSMILLHQRKPLLTYVLSTGIIIFLVLIFDVKLP
jgi:hypothetical protein